MACTANSLNVSYQSTLESVAIQFVFSSSFTLSWLCVADNESIVHYDLDGLVTSTFNWVDLQSGPSSLLC